MSVQASALETVLRRDRTIVLAGLAGVAALAWLYLIVTAARMHAMPEGMGDMQGAMGDMQGAMGDMQGGAMGGMDMPMAMGEAMAMPQLGAWSAADFVLMFLMWAIMMVGMMLPSAAPMILLYARIARRQHEQGQPFAPTGAFAAGYLAVWTAFSALAVTLQWALERAALLSPMMISATPWLGGVLLIVAGIYQLTPLKHACLRHCRGPLDFLTRHWRKGTGGALAMGVEHGAFCVGCCWFLMGLLFVGGVMNLLWVAALAIFVLLEKVAPHGQAIARLSGAGMLAAGLFLVLRG